MPDGCFSTVQHKDEGEGEEECGLDGRHKKRKEQRSSVNGIGSCNNLEAAGVFYPSCSKFYEQFEQIYIFFEAKSKISFFTLYIIHIPSLILLLLLLWLLLLLLLVCLFAWYQVLALPVLCLLQTRPLLNRFLDIQSQVLEGRGCLLFKNSLRYSIVGIVAAHLKLVNK